MSEIFDSNTCVICGCDDQHACVAGRCWIDEDGTILGGCVEAIRDWPKRDESRVLEIVGKAPLWVLEALEREGLSGDWRRAAVRRQIQKLRKEAR